MQFENVSIILPTLRETTLFLSTIEEILGHCEKEDIKEFIVVVCEKTTPESMKYIEKGKVLAQEDGIPYHIINQTRPFLGGALMDGFMAAKGSHVCVETPDWSTAPEKLPELILMAKQFPGDITSCSRWLDKNGFENYHPIKKIWNFCSQKLLQFMYHTDITDFTWGTHIVPTILYQSINFCELKHPFDLEEVVIPLRLGVKFHEIPGTCHIQENDVSVQPLLSNIIFLRPAFRWRFAKESSLIKKNVDCELLKRTLQGRSIAL